MAKGNHTGKGGFAENPQNRNAHGQRNKAAVSFSRSIRDLIVKHGEKRRKAFDKDGNLIRTQKNIEWVVEAIYKEAFAGNMQAVNFIAERVEGKITQPLGEDPTMPFKGYVNITPDDWDKTN